MEIYVFYIDLNNFRFTMEFIINITYEVDERILIYKILE